MLLINVRNIYVNLPKLRRDNFNNSSGYNLLLQLIKVIGIDGSFNYCDCIYIYSPDQPPGMLTLIAIRAVRYWLFNHTTWRQCLTWYTNSMPSSAELISVAPQQWRRCDSLASSAELVSVAPRRSPAPRRRISRRLAVIPYWRPLW